MIGGRVPYDRPIRHGMTQCRAFTTTERDGYFLGANDDIIEWRDDLLSPNWREQIL
jgi:hypothetical protein